MAIEAIIELEIEGLDKLSALEARLDAIRNNPLNAGFGGGGSQPPSLNTPSSAGGGHSNAQFNAQFNQANQSFTNLNRNLNVLNQVTMNYTLSQRNLSNQIRTQSNNLENFGKGLTNITRTLWGLGAHTAKVVTGFTKLGALFTGTGMLAGLAYLINSSKQITERSFGANAYGVNPNDVSRLSATYGRIANVESVLGSVTEQANAPFSMLYTQMGMTQQQAQMMSPEERFRRVMQHGRQAAMSPYGASELSLQQYGLQGTLGVEDLARMRNMSQRDWQGIGQTADQYKSQTQLRDPSAWQEFGMKQSLGMQSLGATSQNLMTPLLAPLNKIFSTVFDKVLGPNVDRKVNIFTKTIDLARIALERINKILSADSWHDFWGRVWQAAKDFWDFLKPEAAKAFESIGKWFREDFPTMAKDAFERLGNYIDEHFPQLAATTDRVVENLRILGSVIEAIGNLFSRLGIIPSAQATRNVTPTGPGFGGTQNAGPNVNNLGNFPFRPEIMAAANAHNLNPALVAAIVEQESSFRPNAIGSQTKYGKAGGLMQLLPMTAQRFGVRDRFDPGQNTMGGSAYLEFLMNRYGNDESRAVAGFYAGEGNVDKAKGQVPSYARSYVDKVLERKKRIEGGMGNSSVSGTTYSNAQVRVNVNNTSSAQAEVQVGRMGGASNTVNQ
jgi:uncharacterized protein YukE